MVHRHTLIFFDTLDGFLGSSSIGGNAAVSESLGRTWKNEKQMQKFIKQLVTMIWFCIRVHVNAGEEYIYAEPMKEVMK